MLYRIIGTGPVALACALWLQRAGVVASRILLSGPPDARPDARPEARPDLEPAVPRALADAGRFPPRRIALADGSCQLLGRITTLPDGGRIEQIEVLQAGASGRTRIRARDFGVGALGRVVDWPELTRALDASARAAGLFGHHTLPPTDGASRAQDPETITIHAEGQSRATDPSGFDQRDFDQAALLTEVEADTNQEPAALAGRIAYECFGPTGPLALLPARAPSQTGQPMRYAVVWCDRIAASQARAGQAPEAVAAELDAVFAGIVRHAARPSRLRVVAPMAAMPLARVRRRQVVEGNAVWIGNAAQALHPVAGQGLNLGLRDAFELARLLADAEQSDPEKPAAARLAAFARARRADRQRTTGLTDLLAASFTWPLARPLQSALLTALDLSGPLRRPLASSLLFGRR